jgi:hypothetical protein
MILKKILGVINLGLIKQKEEITIESYEVLVETLSKSRLS